MTEQHKNFPEFYVTAAQPCPYLAGRQERKLFTHLNSDKPPGLIDNLLRGGFRRSQNIAYIPYCDGCTGCISVRVKVDEFQPRRTMRRIRDRNIALKPRRIAPVPTSEQYGLFRSYIDSRHSDGGMADMTVLDYAMMIEDSVIDTFITEYRVKPDDQPHLAFPDRGVASHCATASRTGYRWSTVSMISRARPTASAPT
jgi:leucyl-tRNA---protein transferase